MEDFQRIQILGQERAEHLLAVKRIQSEIAALVPGARRERYSMEAIARAAGVGRRIVYQWCEADPPEPTN